MPSNLVIEDSGVASVTIRGVRKDLDLYMVANTLRDKLKTHRDAHADPFGPGGQLEWLNQIVAYIIELGYPGATHFEADQFFDRISIAADELGKAPAVEPTPA